MLAGRHLWERSANRHTSRSTSATDCQVAHHRVTCSISCRAAAWFVRQFSTSESDWLESVHVLALGPLSALSGVVIYGAYAWLFTTEVAMNGYSRLRRRIEGAFAIAFGGMGTSLLFSALREMRG